MTVGDADYVQLQTAFFHQCLALTLDLVYQLAAYSADSADKQVQHLIFGKEEAVVNHVKRLAEKTALHHERDIRL